jgi:hypothetical protein
MKQLASLILPLALALSVGACAGPVETRIASAGQGVTAGALMWAPMAEDAQISPLHMAARAAVELQLGKMGYSFAADAPLMLSLGVSERAAGIVLRDGAGNALSPAKGKRLLQDCGDRMLRLSVNVVDRSNGASLYTGSAQEAHCHATLDEAMQRLSTGALADIGQPRGVTVQTASARD